MSAKAEALVMALIIQAMRAGDGTGDATEYMQARKALAAYIEDLERRSR